MASLKLCFGHDGDGDNHGVRRADTAQAHTQWQHLVASHEATNTLYWVTCPVLYLPGSMVVAIAVKTITF
jgi:hypothetical protein